VTVCGKGTSRSHAGICPGPPAAVIRGFSSEQLTGSPRYKSALLINPPVYDTQYWAEWAQPYGLLRIAALLKRRRYKRIELFDFMETDEKRQVPAHRINPDETYEERDLPTSPTRPLTITKGGEKIDLFKRHFGKTWQECDAWLDAQGFDRKHPPHEVWISAVMTYWWESVRDLTIRLKRRFGKKTTILLGGIYPTLAPKHAATMIAADLVVAGEVAEANDLWTDLSLYSNPPQYAVITPSRGCPFNCAYCAQRAINEGRRKVHHRAPEDIVAEMRHKHETYGIREFAFYADAVLADFEGHFQRVLELLVDSKLPFRLHAPEGFDTRSLSKSQRLLELMKQSHFEKLYLPLERLDERHLQSLKRGHARLDHFVRAVAMCEKAGFRLRNLDVNAFVLYGLPEERIDDVVKTVLFVSEIVGSIIPMLFTPVPTTAIYQRYLPYFRKHGWDRELHMLNGKLYPFLELNEGSISDYIDLQRLMYTLNTHYRDASFRVFGDTRVAKRFRENLTNGFGRVVARHRDVASRTR